MKEKILFTEEQETLLIPLYSKARVNRALFVDPKAQEILRSVSYDFDRLKVPYKTIVTVCLRAKKLDAYAREFLAMHPYGVVIHLGCGLDSRCLRVNNGTVTWYDLDLPPVIELRKKYYDETERYHLIASSVTDLHWIDAVSAAERPVLVIAEGLLMYLTEAEVKGLVLKLKDAFPGCGLAFDAFSTLTAGRVEAHPSLKKTGATVSWGIDDPQTMAGWADGIRLQEEWFFSQGADSAGIGWGYRLGFKLASLFAVARRAHRILYYTL